MRAKDSYVPLLTLFILLFALGINVLFLFSPTTLVLNQLFSPCENGFSYDSSRIDATVLILFMVIIVSLVSVSMAPLR